MQSKKPREHAMPVIVNDKGQVTIPEQVRNRFDLVGPDSLDAARGKADVKRRTDDLMALLRGGAPG